MNANDYIDLIGKAGQYICPVCGCVNHQYVMSREAYAARLASWSKLDSKAQQRQVENAFRFAYQGLIAMNARCYDAYFDDPVIDLEAEARMAWKRRDKTMEWFAGKAKRAASVFHKRNSYRAYSVSKAYSQLWDWNHPDQELSDQ